MRDETITRELETIIINQLLLWISDKINLYVYSERFKINSSFTSTLITPLQYPLFL